MIIALAIASFFLLAPTLRAGAITCGKLDNFPTGMTVQETSFDNWSREIRVSKIFVTEAKSADAVVKVANWASKNGFNVRPSGNQFSWSPMTIQDYPETTNECKNIILVKTRPYLTNIEIKSDDKASVVKAGSGATLEDIVDALEKKGLGFGSLPSLGKCTIGGYLATGGHGTGVPNGPKVFGISTSSISNMVTSMQVVVWNSKFNEFVLDTINRNDSRMPPLLANLGRIMITEVTLRVGKNQYFRCQSITDVDVETIFAAPSKSETPTSNSLADYVQRTGYVGILHFPFTSQAWIKLWTNSPNKPLFTRKVNQPYNFVFQNGILPNAAATLQSGNIALTPLVSQAFFLFIKLALSLTGTRDFWGTSKNVLLYASEDSPKISVGSFAILTSNKNLQKVGYNVFNIYQQHLESYRRDGKYPINAPIELRITSTDKAEDCECPNALPPTYTATCPKSDNPDYNIVIWFDVTTFSRTVHVSEFMFDIQNSFLSEFDGTYALIRPEWSKRWGYIKTEPWKNTTVISNYSEMFDNWKEGELILLGLDPHGVFKNNLLKDILQ